MKNRVLVALSGGVDSSTAAIMLKEQGYEVVGVTFNMYNSNERNPSLKRGIKDAMILATKLNIAYYVIDVSKDFQKVVVKHFINEYKNGRTPNPCVLCNHEIKWANLIKVADAFNCKYVATGHYARINTFKGRYYISESNDPLKDQCFFLWRLNQNQLKRTLFPLGALQKANIKKKALTNGLNSIAKKSESYNVCFIPNGDYRDFLNKHLEKYEGLVILENGEKIDNHQGVWNFTLGQKKGFKNAQNDLYVLNVDSKNNEVVVGDLSKLYVNEIIICDINPQKYKELEEQKTYLAKVSYRGELVKTTIRKVSEGYKLTLDKPVRALASGQSITLFEDNDLVAGGIVL